MKYYIYARKSTDSEDKQVQSIDAQLVELRKYAQLHDLEIVGELIEKRTAKKPGRPVFNQMIEDFKSGKVDGVICWAPDRITRNPVDAGTFQWMLSTGEIKDVQFVTQTFSNDPSGKFLLNLGFAQGQQFIENLSINSKRGLIHKARMGWKPGRAPVGYKNDVYAKTIVVDKKLAPVIKQGFELYAEGQTTLEALSDWFFEHKIKTDTGNRMSKDRVRFTLTNTFYIGLFTYAGEIYEGKHKPIIEKTLFDKVQVVLENRGYIRQQPTNDPKPYCGLLTCKTCGMSITATVKQRTQKNGNHHVWTYYHCSRRSKTIDCKEPAMRDEDLDIQLSEIICKCQLSKEDAKFVFEKIADAYEVASQSQNENRIANQQELESLTKQIGRLTEVYLADDIDREEYLLLKQNLLLKKREIEQKNTDKPIQLETRLEPVQKFLDTAQTLGKLADNDNKTMKKFALANLASWNLSQGSGRIWAEGSLVSQGASRSDGSQTHLKPAKQAKNAAEGVYFQKGKEEESPWRYLFEAAFAADKTKKVALLSG